MEFKGTKGKWNIDSFNKTHFIINDNRVLIAEILDEQINSFYTPTPRACKANAKLISAAPELLEALKSCVLSMQSHPDCTENSEFQAFVNKGWEVINKATNEPNNYNTKKLESKRSRRL